MDTEDRKGLTVIDGGKKNPSGKVGPALSGLTAKQEAFAQGLASGLCATESYRQSYDASGMKQTSVEVEACKLSQHPKVAQRVEDLLKAKEAKAQHVAARNEDRIWRQVWGVLEDDKTPAAVKVSAATLAAKLSGMMVEKLEVKGAETPEAIEKELLQRLARYK
jgi:hypothetical protein